jgi:hypothetical protein
MTMLVALVLTGTRVEAAAAVPKHPRVGSQHVVAISAAQAAQESRKSSSAAKPIVSPYARAAAERERTGKAPAGHAQAVTQGLGQPGMSAQAKSH